MGIKIIKLKCKLAGKEPQCFDTTVTYACRYCSGEITLYVEEETNKILMKKLEKSYPATVPRKYRCGFDCPAMLPDPRQSNLVEQVQ